MKSLSEITVSILRTGLLLSVIIVAIGGALYLLENGSNGIHYQAIDNAPQYETVAEMLRQVSNFSAEGIISFGLFVLVFTQVVRVALTTLFFIAEKDLVFALISLSILIILIYSIFGWT